MALYAYPKTAPRPTAVKKLRAILPASQLKRLKSNRDIVQRLTTAFKNGSIDRELEHLGYSVVTKCCMSSNVAFYAVGYKIDDTWCILSVMTTTEYEEITRTLRGEAMVTALIGGNIHLKG